MNVLRIWQRLSELKAGIAATGARLLAPSKAASSPAQWDQQTVVERAGVANSAALGAAGPFAVRRKRPPSRYY